MAHTTCLVCSISTVNGHSNKKRKEAYPWKASPSGRHITNLKQSILETFDIYGGNLPLYEQWGTYYNNNVYGFPQRTWTSWSPMASSLLIRFTTLESRKKTFPSSPSTASGTCTCSPNTRTCTFPENSNRSEINSSRGLGPYKQQNVLSSVSGFGQDGSR